MGFIEVALRLISQYERGLLLLTLGEGELFCSTVAVQMSTGDGYLFCGGNAVSAQLKQQLLAFTIGSNNVGRHNVMQVAKGQCKVKHWRQFHQDVWRFGKK